MFGWLFRKRSGPPGISYARFTDRARKVMQLANQEAQRFNHEYIGTEHILLGLVEEGGGVGARVAERLGAGRDAVRTRVDGILATGPAGGPVLGGDRFLQTPRAKKVIEYTIEEARALKCQHVGTEHLLLGLLREEEGVAAVVLTELGVTLEQARAEVRAMLNPPPK